MRRSARAGLAIVQLAVLGSVGLREAAFPLPSSSCSSSIVAMANSQRPALYLGPSVNTTTYVSARVTYSRF